MRAEIELNTEEEAFRLEISKKIGEMITARIPLSEIAAMFGAEEFLSEEGRGRKKALRFDVEGFVGSLIANNEHLKCPDNTFKVNEVFIPADEGEVETGSGEGLERKEIIPRSKYLMEVLYELNEKYILGNGENDPSMMRSYSYQIFVISGLEKAVLVNNEKGNATFVYHHDSEDVKNEEGHKPFREMSDEELIQFGKEFAQRHSKEDLRKMEDRVSTLIYFGNSEKWKAKMTELLTNPVPEKVKIEKKEFKDPPEGWMTEKALARHLGINPQTVHRRAKRYREDHPDWFGEYNFRYKNGSRGPLAEHLSPELADIIREDIAEVGKAPEGWLTIRVLSEELGKDPSTIERRAGEYRKSNPDWFERYRVSGGHVVEHFSPELVDIIKKNIEAIEAAPEGWMTVSRLKRDIGKINERTIKNMAEEYRESNPDWFKMYYGLAGRETEHLSPELISIIKDRLRSKENAPEGWLTIGSLSSKLGKDHGTIKRRTDKYRKDHPDWFKEYKTPTGHTREHLAPELVERVREDLEK